MCLCWTFCPNILPNIVLGSLTGKVLWIFWWSVCISYFFANSSFSIAFYLQCWRKYCFLSQCWGKHCVLILLKCLGEFAPEVVQACRFIWKVIQYGFNLFSYFRLFHHGHFGSLYFLCYLGFVSLTQKRTLKKRFCFSTSIEELPPSDCLQASL